MMDDSKVDVACQELRRILGRCKQTTGEIWVADDGHPALEGKFGKDVLFDHEVYHFLQFNGTPLGYAFSALSRMPALRTLDTVHRLHETGCQKLLIPLVLWKQKEERGSVKELLGYLTDRCTVLSAQLGDFWGGEVESALDHVSRFRGIPPCVVINDVDPRWSNRLFALGMQHVIEGAAAFVDMVHVWGALSRGDISVDTYNRFVQYQDVHVGPEYRVMLAAVSKFFRNCSFDRDSAATCLALCDLSMQGCWLGGVDPSAVGGGFLSLRQHHPGWRLMQLAECAAQIDRLSQSALTDTSGEDYKKYTEELSKRVFPDCPTPLQIAELCSQRMDDGQCGPWDRRYKGLCKFRLEHPNALAFPWLFWRELVSIGEVWWVNDMVKFRDATDSTLMDAFAQIIAQQLLLDTEITCPSLLRSHCRFENGCTGQGPIDPRSDCMLRIGFETMFGFALEGVHSVS